MKAISSIVVLGVALTAAAAGDDVGVTSWLIPPVNYFHPEITRDHVNRYTSCRESIWESCSKDYVLRWIIPRPVDALTEVKVVSLLVREGGGYRKEIVEFVFVEDQNRWKIDYNHSAEIDTPSGNRGYEVARSFLALVQAGPGSNSGGYDVPVVRWEALKSLSDRSLGMYSADQVDMPKNPVHSAALSSVIGIMMGE